jgi:predicted nucleic acid-binding protein
VEADRIFLAKFPNLIDQFRAFIKSLAPLLADDPKPPVVQEAKAVIHSDDAPILAAAKQERVDYLVTFDIKHFHISKVRNYLMIPIGTPAEFLKAFRKFWEQAG